MDEKNNQTSVIEFILLGFTNHPELQAVLFLLFLAIYLITMAGSLSMIVIIRVQRQLHTPMYFFLSHLAFVDTCYTSAIAPKMLVNFFTDDKTISYAGCASQIALFAAFVSTECFLLAAMAYDRYVAICNPLLYTITMSQTACAWLVGGAYLAGCVNSAVQTVCVFRLSFCGPNVIDHFFCDIPQLLKLSCSDTFLSESLSLLFSALVGLSTITSILASYFCIFAAVLRMPSAEGRRKALSTCTSHLTSVALLYGTGFYMYLHPQWKSGRGSDVVISIFYTLIIPMLNPLIYSLRNKEVKAALKKVMRRK
ncbi:olfactory receptor 5A1-like [Pelodiscus sinensis]|uniref:olfactory receptor 5A1-like n=1 Tax=Pelodiscus sinensis TaxID=13735 RepID=UPI0003C42986|nr:olfactory receptor 5A1-like [Pelodiscus sinensis]|eukprot:XP_006116998.1 olfactory receptor 5A1-like [Pelodiscus sinensis]